MSVHVYPHLYKYTGRQPVSMGDVLAQAPPEAKAEVVEEEGGSDEEEEEEGGKGAGGIKYVGVLIRFDSTGGVRIGLDWST